MLAESLKTALPTTLPTWLALVLIDGLALMMLADSFSPLSMAPLYRTCPRLLAGQRCVSYAVFGYARLVMPSLKSGSVHLYALLSFPTRRSSDLEPAPGR